MMHTCLVTLTLTLVYDELALIYCLITCSIRLRFIQICKYNVHKFHNSSLCFLDVQIPPTFYNSHFSSFSYASYFSNLQLLPQNYNHEIGSRQAAIHQIVIYLAAFDIESLFSFVSL